METNYQNSEHMVTFETMYGTITARKDQDAKAVALFATRPSFFENDIAIMCAFITPEDEVIDVGANIGSVTIPLARRARRVHAFEPISATADILERNIRQNNLSNVVLNRIGLSDVPGLLYADLVDDAGGNSLKSVGEGESVPVSTLDAYAASMRISFMKIDVEGMEAQVLAGGQACIAASRPVIFFEVHTGNMREYGVSFKTLSNLLPGYAFFFNLHGEQDGHYRLGKLSWLGILRFASGTLNVLAVPIEKADFVYVGALQTLGLLVVRKLKNKLRQSLWIK